MRMHPSVRSIITTITSTPVVAVIALFSATATPVLADTGAVDATLGGLTNTAKKAGLGSAAPSLTDILGPLINSAFALTGVIFVILMIYGGFLYMQARGNEDDTKKAKAIITNAIIGIIILALAFAITNFVIGAIGTATTK